MEEGFKVILASYLAVLMLERSGVFLPAFIRQSLFLSAGMISELRRDLMLKSICLGFTRVWALHPVVFSVKLERFKKFPQGCKA
jgi:hypothetical protein